MLNLPKLIELRNHLQTVEDSEFLYEEFYAKGKETYFLLELPPRGCGTTGCVAGHAAWLWKDEFIKKASEYITGSEVIGAGILGLDSRQQEFLLFVNCGTAGRLDAIARLDWLIEGKDVSAYDFEVEPRQA